MFTSQQLRAVLRPGTVSIREQRIDDAVHQVGIRGEIIAQNVPEIARRVDAALHTGVRWLIVDLAEATAVDDQMLAALVRAVRELRSRRGELLLAGADASVRQRLEAWPAAYRPALAASLDQALLTLKLMRPKTQVPKPYARARQRVTSLTLPRIEPPGPRTA